VEVAPCLCDGFEGARTSATATTAANTTTTTTVRRLLLLGWRGLPLWAGRLWRYKARPDASTETVVEGAIGEGSASSSPNSIVLSTPTSRVRAAM